MTDELPLIVQRYYKLTEKECLTFLFIKKTNIFHLIK